jgi:tetratricopeptide (TPR) repeat protein
MSVDPQFIDKSIEITPVYETLTQQGEERLAAGNLEGAEEAFRGALNALEEINKNATMQEPFGLIALAQMNLATVLIRQKRYDEAETYLNKALNEISQKRGVEHPLFAYGLRQLASVLLTKRQIPEAKGLLEWVVELGEKQLGSHHPGLIKPLQALMEIHQDLGEEATVIEIQRRILSIENHPGRWRLFLTEGNQAYVDQDWTRAEVCFMNALNLIREMPENSTLEEMARVCHNLASVFKCLGKISQAEPLAQEALKLYENLYGEKDYQIKAPLKNLAEILVESGQDKASKNLFKRLEKLQ